MAIVHHVSGSTTTLIEPTLQELQCAVGGYIEVADTIGTGYLLVNEDGYALQLARNATFPQWLGNVVQVTFGEFQ